MLSLQLTNVMTLRRKRKDTSDFFSTPNSPKRTNNDINDLSFYTPGIKPKKNMIKLKRE